jgi:simple sugar transport system substrate-binding protein
MIKTVMKTAIASAALLAFGSVAQAADMSCAGKKFVFFPGGPEGGAFASIVYNGAVLAAEQTGCKVEYVWSDWNPEKMVRQFSEAIARQPDGIALMGHPGEAALGPLVDKARAAGIIVTTQNVELPTYEAKNVASGFGYVGAKNYSAGVNLGKGTAATCSLKKGDVAFVWGLLGQEARGLRTKGVIDAFEEIGVEVKYLEIADNVNKDAAQGIPTFSAFLAANPKISVVVTDHGALTATLPAYLKAAGKKPKEICAAGFDVSAATAQGIKTGYVTVVLDQQPFLQGFLPIMQLYLSTKFGFAGMNIDTGAALISSANIAAVEGLAKEAIR